MKHCYRFYKSSVVNFHSILTIINKWTRLFGCTVPSILNNKCPNIQYLVGWFREYGFRGFGWFQSVVLKSIKTKIITLCPVPSLLGPKVEYLPISRVGSERMVFEVLDGFLCLVNHRPSVHQLLLPPSRVKVSYFSPC